MPDSARHIADLILLIACRAKILRIHANRVSHIITTILSCQRNRPIHTMTSLDFPLDDTKIQQEHEPNDDGNCPEGGWRAWSVVLGAWCAMVPSMGMLNTIGILDAWIGENQLEALPKSQTAWIVSLYAFFLYIGGSCAGTQTTLYLWQQTTTD
jgi:hypothetical protein